MTSNVSKKKKRDSHLFSYRRRNKNQSISLKRKKKNFKYGFHYYSGMIKPKYQKGTAIEKRVCYVHRSHEQGALHILGASHREALG